MTEVHARIKKWGNSFGIVLPKDVVDAENLKEDQEITFFIMKPVFAKDIFGIAKSKIKKPTAEILREIRKEIW